MNNTITHRAALAFALAAAISGSAFAQTARRPSSQNSFASDYQTVPVMANVSGRGGAKFESYVSILNPTSSAYTVDVTLYDSNGTTHDATISLAAGEMKTYSNFLSTVFSYVGGGAVEFASPESAGGTHNNRFIVSTEVRTGSGNSVFSTPVPSLEFAGSSSPSFAGGVTVDSNWRTNVGCYNQASSANNVTIKVLDKSGATTIGTMTLNLAANAWAQGPVSAVVSDGYVRFEPSDSAVCYAVVVSNTTNDGRFIPATEYTP